LVDNITIIVIIISAKINIWMIKLTLLYNKELQPRGVIKEFNMEDVEVDFQLSTLNFHLSCEVISERFVNLKKMIKM